MRWGARYFEQGSPRGFQPEPKPLVCLLLTIRVRAPVERGPGRRGKAHLQGGAGGQFLGPRAEEVRVVAGLGSDP